MDAIETKSLLTRVLLGIGQPDRIVSRGTTFEEQVKDVLDDKNPRSHIKGEQYFKGLNSYAYSLIQGVEKTIKYGFWEFLTENVAKYTRSFFRHVFRKF